MLSPRLRTWTWRILLGVAGLGLALGSLFAWQVTNGPVSLGILTPQLEAMINGGLKGIRFRFDDSTVAWSDGRKLAHLQFSGVRVVDENEGVIARVPKANLTLSGPALLVGTAAPTEVELMGVSANIVRRAGGELQLGLQVKPASGKRAPENTDGPGNEGVIREVLRAMLEPGADDNLSRYLRRFAIVDARLSVFDEETRSSWIADKASLVFERRANGVSVSIKAPVKLSDGKVWQFSGAARYVKGSTSIAIEAAFNPVSLDVLAANGSGLRFLSGFRIPVAGNLACGLQTSGVLGRCKFWLNAREGHLHLPALKRTPIHLKEAAVTAEIDFRTGRYALSEMAWKGETMQGSVSGEGQLALLPDGNLQSLSADWTAENLFLDAPNLFDGGFALEQARFKGVFDAQAKTLAIETLTARRGAFELALAGALQDNPVSMGVRLAGTARDLAIPDLKRLWPAGAVPGARDWIFRNIHEGSIKAATINVDLLPGAIVGERIPDEMLNVGLELTGLKVTYLEGLPDLTGVDGSAVLTGDRFRAEIKSGGVGTVALKNGRILIDELHKTGTTGNIEGTMAGPTRDLLLLIDRPRLNYPTRYGLDAARAGGTANVDFAFQIPMLRDLNTEDIGIDVNAELSDVKLPINPRFGITGGKFSLKLDMKALKAIGSVHINGAPVGFIWNEDFTGTAKHGTRIEVTATLNENQRDVFGLQASPYLAGRTAIFAVFTGRGGKVENARIDAKLGASRLAIPELNWAKPEDSAATLTANVALKPGNTIELTDIDASGRDIKAQGRVVLVGSEVVEADFAHVELGKRNDFALNYRARPAQPRTLAVKGKALDIAGLLDGDDDAGDAGAPVGAPARPPMSVTADIASLHLKSGVSWNNVRLAYNDDGVHLTRFGLNAMDQNARLSGELATGTDGSRKFSLQSADAGRLLRGLTGFRSLIGGTLKVDADLLPLARNAKANEDFDGQLLVEDFKIVDQPFLARLLSAGSFTGLGDLLGGEGITFSMLRQTVRSRGGVLTLSEGRASGPSIGITVQGTYQRNAGKLDLNGTIVPIYALNSIFDDIPVVGGLLGSREGEGMFGVTYGIRGDVDDLKVAVNPVSMLAPGFLRRLFEGERPELAAPMPLPMALPEELKR